MTAYIVVDGFGAVLEAYSGHSDGAPSNAIAISDALYRTLPRNIAGWTYRPASGDVPAQFVAPITPAPESQPVYIPAYLVRQRLESVSLWDAAVTAMSDAQKLKFATLQNGILPDDAEVIALLTGIGADPAAVLAISA